jgi:hypothetical protein
MSSNRISPNRREILSAQSTVTGQQEYLLSTNGALNTTSSGGGSGGTQYQELATTSPATGTLALGRYQTSLPTLTNGEMNEPMLDSTSTILVNSSTLATATNQTTMNSSLTSIVTNTGTSATSANQTNGTQQTKLTDGTNVANVVSGDTGYNGVVVNSGTKTYPFTTSSTGAQTLLANTPTEGYAWVTVVFTSVGSGLALTGPWSPISGGTYVGTNTWSTGNNSTSGTSTLGNAVNIIYKSPVHSNYIQLMITAMTAGTTSGYLILTNAPLAYQAIQVALQGNTAATNADGMAVSTNAQIITTPFVYNGSTWDRTREVIGDGQAVTGIIAGNNMLFNGGTTYDRMRGGQGDGAGSTGIQDTTGRLYNGSTYDRPRSYGAIAAGTSTGVSIVGIAGGLMPIGTSLNTYEALLTTNATTTVTASTAYISSIVITVVTGQTGGNITITDGQGTPQTLVNGLSTVTATLSPTTMDFSTPIKMTTGIKVITTSSVTAATIAVWINYYQ